MTKVDSSSPSLTLHSASIPGLESAHRLIVLVPADEDYSGAAHRVWELAHATERSIQLIGMYSDVAQEFSLRRQLATMSAMIQDDKVHANARLEIGTDWVRAVKSELHDGDMIVCFAEQRAGILQRPLSQILESKLRIPVYVLSGLFTRKRPRPNWLSEIVVWTGSLGIIAVFILLQIRIESLPDDWAQTTLMILSVLVEAWLIGTWNGLLG